MKRLTAFWLSACFLCTISVQAQSFIPERDSSDISLFEYATKIPKRNNVFNLDLEMHASFNTFFTGHKLDEAAFRFNHIKIEATGEVNDRLFYWYRQNLNQGNEGMDLENLPESIEYAMIGYRLNDKFTITLGKQDAAWGGFEYDLDPYAIYEYSDMNGLLFYRSHAWLSAGSFPGTTFASNRQPNREHGRRLRPASRRNRKATRSAFLHI